MMVGEYALAFIIKDSCCVITGAANGIGAALASELAGRGANLVLVDQDQSGLQSVVELLGSCEGRVMGLVCDLRDRVAVAALPDQVAASGLRPDCVINNAGIGSMGLFTELTDSEFQRVFDINFWGAVRVVRAFLPGLLEREKARIVNVSSIFGLIAAADQSPYVASKFAIRGFSESLAIELAETGVGVSVVYPGGIATSIAQHAAVAERLDGDYARQKAADYTRILKLPPDVAARIIADGIASEQARILIGRETRLMDFIQRLLPSRYLNVMIRQTLRIPDRERRTTDSG